MKYIGFIKEHDNILEAISFNDIIKEKTTSSEEVSLVFNYLNNGTLVFGWMGYFRDLNCKKDIAPHSYYTDGNWVWPSYFQYYLSKYSNYRIDEEFITYLLQKQFKTYTDIDKVHLNAIEHQLSLKLQNGN